MDEPALQDARSASPSHFRWRKSLLLLGLLVLPLGILGAFVCISFLSDFELKEALSEAQRLDGDWRIQALEAKRAVIPESENAAIPASAAHKLLPAQWPYWEYTSPASQLGLGVWKLDSNVQLNGDQITALRQELARAEAALTEARKATNLSQGRYPPSQVAVDFLATHGSSNPIAHARAGGTGGDSRNCPPVPS